MDFTKSFSYAIISLLWFFLEFLKTFQHQKVLQLAKAYVKPLFLIVKKLEIGKTYFCSYPTETNLQHVVVVKEL